MDIQVEPGLVNQAYKQMLAETQSRLQEQVVMLQAACTQLQNEAANKDSQIETLNSENELLKSQVTAQTGRQDGVPQDDLE